MVERWRWLRQWWFLTAVAILALNDHVLKARYGNWFTGKLSDVVGPVVVATLLAVLVGRRAGVALAAVGFVALKTVPGVAEAAAPILGGVTLRDATDLLGLVGLVPTWWLMGSHLPDPPTPSSPTAWASNTRQSANLTPKPKQRVAETTAWASNTRQSANLTPKPKGLRAEGQRRVRPLSVVGLVLAVMVTTATSDDDTPPSSVTRVMADDTVVWAEITGGSHDWEAGPDDPPRVRFYVSHDGGMTWEEASGAPPRPRSRPRRNSGTSADDSGGRSADGEACRSDGWCFRAQGQVVQHRPPEGRWSTSFALSWDKRNLFQYRSYDYNRGFDYDLPGNPVVVSTDSGEHVVVPMRYEGVLVLDADGHWHRRAVGGIAPTDISGTFLFLAVGRWMIPIMGLLALFWIPLRAIQRGLIRGATKALTGVAALIIGVLLWLSTVATWMIGEFNRQDPMDLGPLLIASSLLVLLIPLGFIRMLAGPVITPGPDCLTEPALGVSDVPPSAPPAPSPPAPLSPWAPGTERPPWDPETEQPPWDPETEQPPWDLETERPPWDPGAER